MAVDDKTLKLVKHVSDWLFSIDGRDKVAFPGINNKISRDLKSELKQFMKANGIEMVDTKLLDSAREFVDECGKEKYGFTVEKTRKNEFLKTFLDTNFKTFVKNEYYDFNSMSATNLKRMFADHYDKALVQKKIERLDILVNRAIDLYKSDQKGYVEEYAAYKKKRNKGDYDNVDREYKEKKYISSESFNKYSKLGYLETHCLVSRYRYSKSNHDIYEKECTICHAQFITVLGGDCPCCGNRLPVIKTVLNGEYSDLSEIFLDTTSKIVGKLVAKNFDNYEKLYNYNGSEKKFVDENYPWTTVIDVISSTLVEEKFKELDDLQKMPAEEAMAKIHDIKQDYSELQEELKKVLKDRGYPEKLNKISSDIKKNYYEKKTKYFRSKVNKLSTSKDYLSIKKLLDEYDTYDSTLQTKIRNEGAIRELNELMVNVSEELTTGLTAQIVGYVSKDYSTFKEASDALESIDSVIRNTDFPIEAILAKKGIDKDIEALKEKCNLLRLKEATEPYFRITEDLYTSSRSDEKYVEEAGELVKIIEGLPKDEFDYYKDNIWSKYISVNDKMYLASIRILLKSNYSNLIEEKQQLDEIAALLKLISNGEHTKEKKELSDVYDDRLAQYNDKVRIEKIEDYTRKVYIINPDSYDIDVYNDALKLRNAINKEDKKTLEELTKKGIVSSLDEKLSSIKANCDKKAILDIVEETHNVHAADVIRKGPVVKLINKLKGMDQEQSSLFSKEYGASVDETLTELKEAVENANDVTSEMKSMITLGYERVDRKKMIALHEYTTEQTGLHVAIIKGSPAYKKFELFYGEYEHWFYDNYSKKLTVLINDRTTLEQFIRNHTEFVRIYNSLDEELRQRREIQDAFKVYEAKKKEFVKKQQKDFSAAISKTKKNLTKENVDSLKSKHDVLIDKRSSEYRNLKVEYDEIMANYQVQDIMEMIDEAYSYRGAFGLKMKKNKSKIMSTYQRIISKPDSTLDRLPPKYKNKLKELKNDYDKLRKV